MISQLTDQESQDMIKNHPGVIVMFYANWCGSCRLFKPKFEKISNKQAYSALQFVFLNAEECPQMRKLAKVNALPFFASFKHGSLEDCCPTLREEQICRMASALVAVIN